MDSGDFCADTVDQSIQQLIKRINELKRENNQLEAKLKHIKQVLNAIDDKTNEVREFIDL